jgi:predicted nucleic acid-binding protein
LSAYADTSFLVSLYVLDANSPGAAARMARARLPLLLTSLGEVELTNALYLRTFRRELPVHQVKAAHGMFRKDIADGVFQMKPLPAAVFERAMRMARLRTPRLGARMLDVLHVASAVILGVSDFFTFDKNQAKLARAEGLTVP